MKQREAQRCEWRAGRCQLWVKLFHNLHQAAGCRKNLHLKGAICKNWIWGGISPPTAVTVLCAALREQWRTVQRKGSRVQEVLGWCFVIGRSPQVQSITKQDGWGQQVSALTSSDKTSTLLFLLTLVHSNILNCDSEPVSQIAPLQMVLTVTSVKTR